MRWWEDLVAYDRNASRSAATSRNAGTHRSCWDMGNARLVLDAHCRVDEPSPARRHYSLALLWTTSADRRWRVELSIRLWAAPFPRLIVSDWEDSSAKSALVGMRWGVRATKRLLR